MKNRARAHRTQASMAPLLLTPWRIKVWPWTNQMGLREWLAGYRVNARLHRSPAFLSALAEADREAAKEPTYSDGQQVIDRLRAGRTILPTRNGVEVVELTPEEEAAQPHRKSFDICSRCMTAWPCEAVQAQFDSCQRHETSPNPCRCPCNGCAYHCGAHDPSCLFEEAL